MKYIWGEKEEFDWKLAEELHEIPATPDKKKLFRVVFEIFPKYIANIEILLEESESLVKIWFPKLPVCTAISPEIKKVFIEEVDRSNPQSKLIGLMNSINIINSQMISEVNIQTF